MMEHVTVLVLSSGYEPLTQVSWKKAVSMWTSGRVEVVEEYDNIFIRTVDKAFKAPSVVRFLGKVYRRFKYGVKLRFSRNNIYLRDGGRCQYCLNKLSKDKITLDHVVPVSKGGKKTWENIVLSCMTCNQKKGNRTLEQANMKLIKIPKIPSSLPIFLGTSGLSAGWLKWMVD